MYRTIEAILIIFDLICVQLWQKNLFNFTFTWFIFHFNSFHEWHSGPSAALTFKFFKFIVCDCECKEIRFEWIPIGWLVVVCAGHDLSRVVTIVNWRQRPQAHITPFTKVKMIDFYHAFDIICFYGFVTCCRRRRIKAESDVRDFNLRWNPM